MLRGKIAAIVDDESVVINLGSEHGVKPGMKFTAVYETGNIADPDNPKEALGVLKFVIAKLQATNVQERMTLCSILDPYVSTGFDFLLPSSLKTESKVDPGVTKIGSSEERKLRVGTIVLQAPDEGEKSQSAQKSSTK